VPRSNLENLKLYCLGATYVFEIVRSTAIICAYADASLALCSASASRA
jgi:hypothetical protein